MSRFHGDAKSQQYWKSRNPLVVSYIYNLPGLPCCPDLKPLSISVSSETRHRDTVHGSQGSKESQENENEIREPATKRLDPDSKFGNIIEASLARAFP